jgi:hypothetical protein
MELTPTDDDKDKVPAADAKPAVPPLASILNLSSEKPLFAPKEEKEPAPPMLTPSILRVEAAPVIPPEMRAEAEDEEKKKEEADDDSPAPAVPVRPHIRAPEAAAEEEDLTPLLHESELPPSAAPAEEISFTPPAPMEQPAMEAAWLPPAPAERPPKPPSPPVEFAIFQREPTPEATPPLPPQERPAEEPAVAWQRPMRHEVPTENTATSSYESSYVQPHTHEEIWRLRRDHAADILMVALGGWWLNHKINKQRKENEQAFKQVGQEQRVQTENAEFLRYQATAQGQRLEQLAHSQAQPLPEKKPPITPADIEQLREQIKAAEQAKSSELDPDQHIVRSWYDEVVNSRGEVILGAREHGRAFQEEQRAEQAGYRFAQYRPAPAQTTYYDAYGNPVHPTVVHATNPLLGQDSPPAGLPPVSPADAKQRNALATAALSPWVWVGLAVLLLAFFSAAFL